MRILTESTTRVDQPALKLPELGGVPSLVQIYGADLGKRYSVDQQLSLGRSHSNDVVLALDNVSRHHALVFRRGGRAYVSDRGSTNGTFVNDSRIEHETSLEHGDLIKIGGAIFRFIGPDNAEAHYHEEIYQLAITDGLTGLRNRRYFEDFLDREVARSERSGADLSLVLFDVDGFKRLNDEHGHLFGDRLLRELAKVAGVHVRREQLLARFGGDEFGLVLPDVALSSAQAFAEKLRALTEAQTFGLDGGHTDSGDGASTSPITVRVTLSLGVAQRTPEGTKTQLLEDADRALYRAKSEGRNRVVAATSERE